MLGCDEWDIFLKAIIPSPQVRLKAVLNEVILAKPTCPIQARLCQDSHIAAFPAMKHPSNPIPPQGTKSPVPSGDRNLFEELLKAAVSTEDESTNTEED